MEAGENALRLSPGKFAAYAALAFAACFYGLPLLWLFIAGTRSEASLLGDSPFTLGSWSAFARRGATSPATTISRS